MNLKKLLSELVRFNGSQLMMVQDSANPEMAVPVTTAMMASGGGGGTAAPALPVRTYPGQALVVTSGDNTLSPPFGATHALVSVTAGTVRMSLGGSAAQAPLYPTDTTISLSGVQLSGLHLTSTDGAQVWVDYWREG